MAGKSKGDNKASAKQPKTLSAKNAKQVKGGALLNPTAVMDFDYKAVSSIGSISSVKLSPTRNG